jgi:beta-fructofuranosidase
MRLIGSLRLVDILASLNLLALATAYWTKYLSNPVIPSPPPDLDLLGFRDHSVWNEDGPWYQAIGSGSRDVGGTVLLYPSGDLLHRDYLHPILVGARAETGDLWECPDLFPLGDAYFLLVSPIPLRKTLYFAGSFREHRLSVERQGVVDDGPDEQGHRPANGAGSGPRREVIDACL